MRRLPPIPVPVPPEVVASCTALVVLLVAPVTSRAEGPAPATAAGGLPQLSAPVREASAPDTLPGELDELRQEIESYEELLEGGKVGVGVLHLESGRSLFYRGDERFPMASTYKVPIATQLLARVDDGEMSLDSLVEVRKGHLHPGSGVLEELFDDPGVILSVRNLMDLMLLISDNSATDLCMRLAGGPDAINRKMRELGVGDLRVDRPTVALIADYYGVDSLPPTDRVTPETWEELTEGIPEEEREAAREAFNRDPRDTSTPRAMTGLLERIWRSEALSDSSTALLKDVLREVRTGTARLKGMLHDSTEVSHKTGTIGGTLNDVGVIELPPGEGHVITVVFTKESELDRIDRAEVVAHVARAVYDFFRFNRDGGPAAAGGSP